MSFSWPCRKCGHFTSNLFYLCEKCGTPERRIPYDWARVECPTCGAQPEFRCRALTSGRTTDAHSRRIEMGNLDRHKKSREVS